MLSTLHRLLLTLALLHLAAGYRIWFPDTDDYSRQSVYQPRRLPDQVYDWPREERQVEGTPHLQPVVQAPARETNNNGRAIPVPAVWQNGPVKKVITQTKLLVKPLKPVVVQPQQSASRPLVQPQPSRPVVQPQASRPSVQPQASKPVVQPQASRPSVQPQASKPSVQPLPSRPVVQPQPSRPVVQSEQNPKKDDLSLDEFTEDEQAFDDYWAEDNLEYEKALKKSPSACVWAIISCCKPSGATVGGGNKQQIRYNCFEAMNCHGAFWDVNPCSRPMMQAALQATSEFYNVTPQ